MYTIPTLPISYDIGLKRYSASVAWINYASFAFRFKFVYCKFTRKKKKYLC